MVHHDRAYQLLHSSSDLLSGMRSLHEYRRAGILDFFRLTSLQGPLRPSIFGFSIRYNVSVTSTCSRVARDAHCPQHGEWTNVNEGEAEVMGAKARGKE